MTSDALLVVQCLFSTIWSLFTSWYIPGTNVTPAMFFLFLGSAGLGITFIVRLLTVNPGLSSSSVHNVVDTVHPTSNVTTSKPTYTFTFHKR